MENSILQKHIGMLMNKGFEKAAKSFSQIIGRTLSFSHSNVVLLDYDQEFTHVTPEQGNLTVLTTNMIGDLSGKSFLILDEQERDEVYRLVSPAKEMDKKLQEALLLEIDNIISASVIAQLADELGIEVYGDVPHIQHVKAGDLKKILSSGGLLEDQANILLCSTAFLFDKRDHIHPQFIWKLSAKVSQMIQQQIII